MNKTNFFKKVLFTLLFVSNFTFAGAYSLKDAVNSTLLNNEGLQIEKKKLEIAILEKPKAATPKPAATPKATPTPKPIAQSQDEWVEDEDGNFIKKGD